MIDPLKYTPKGDKQNSDFFNEYRLKIYERRISTGLNDLLGNMCAVAVQTHTGDAFKYLKELYVMTPYRYRASFISDSHKIYCLVNQKDTPVYFVLEPLDHVYEDELSRINKLYPNAREKYNARYIGEIFKTKNLKETKAILLSQNFQFRNPDVTKNKFYCNEHVDFTRLSDLTFNSVGYTEADIFDFEALELGQPFSLTKKELAELDKINKLTEDNGTKPLIKGIDHLATRILAGEREDAILEFLCLANYYFWGAYNIGEMNSSTNVNRVPHGNDIRSPAKVFTANNTPYMVNSFKNLPMPTEDFVRNYGRRLHHIAMEILDGDHKSGVKNIDYVIHTLRDQAHVSFLAKIFGECNDEPDLKQIFSTHSALSLLITEYVERCHGFDGFFTKENVAALTEAAGLDEQLKSDHKNGGVIGD
jgi:hypothetical protein